MALIDRRAAVGALLPLVAAVGAVVATYHAGLAIPAVEALIGPGRLAFGASFDRMPALAFAVVFVMARLIVLLFVAGRPPFLLRLVLTPVALALVLAAVLWPIVGGLVLDPRLASGTPPTGPEVTGHGLLADGAVAGAMLGLVAMLARGLVDWSWNWTWGKPLRALLALAAFAAMGAILAGGWSPLAGSGETFPRAPLTLVQTVGLCGLVIVATIAHVLVAALGDAARRPPPA